MDFVHDILSCGRKFRALSIVDMYSRECLAVEVDTSLTGKRVVRVLERLRDGHGVPEVSVPEVIQTDNGSELTGRTVDQWAYQNKVKMFFIEPGKPTQDGKIESFNGKLRDECLNLEWFTSLAEARTLIEKWREDYNQVKSHSVLENLPPAIWRQKQQTTAKNSAHATGINLGTRSVDLDTLGLEQRLERVAGLLQSAAPTRLTQRQNALGTLAGTAAQTPYQDEVEALHDASKERLQHQNYRLDLELRKLKESL